MFTQTQSNSLSSQFAPHHGLVVGAEAQHDGVALGRRPRVPGDLLQHAGPGAVQQRGDPGKAVDVAAPYERKGRSRLRLKLDQLRLRACVWFCVRMLVSENFLGVSQYKSRW